MNARRIALGATALVLSFVAGLTLAAGVTAAPATEIAIASMVAAGLLMFGSNACFCAFVWGEWHA